MLLFWLEDLGKMKKEWILDNTVTSEKSLIKRLLISRGIKTEEEMKVFKKLGMCSFMAYMGVRTCSHKTIYDIKELPKARKAQTEKTVQNTRLQEDV